MVEEVISLAPDLSSCIAVDYVDLSKNRAFLQKAFSHRYSSCIDSLPNGAAAEGRSD